MSCMERLGTGRRIGERQGKRRKQQPKTDIYKSSNLLARNIAKPEGLRGKEAPSQPARCGEGCLKEACVIALLAESGSSFQVVEG